MVIIKIPNQIYAIPVHVFIGEYDKYYNYILNNYDTTIVDNGEKALGVTVPVKDKEGCSIITLWLSRFKSNDSNDLSILTHECVHASNMIFDKIGVKIDSDNDEHVAYMTQYLFYQTVRTYNKNKRSGKNDDSNKEEKQKRNEAKGE